MTPIKCCVRLERGTPVLFHAWRGMPMRVDKSMRGAVVSSADMRSLPRADDVTAQAFIAGYQDYLRTLPGMGEVVCVAVSRIRI